jgi:hypothetical protein
MLLLIIPLFALASWRIEKVKESEIMNFLAQKVIEAPGAKMP